MQTERVTFLTTPDHKAALDAFAAANGKSVGYVVREATSKYLAQAPSSNGVDEEEALALLLPQVEAAVADMQQTFEAMRADIARASAAIDAALEGESS